MGCQSSPDRAHRVSLPLSAGTPLPPFFLYVCAYVYVCVRACMFPCVNDLFKFVVPISWWARVFMCVCLSGLRRLLSVFVCACVCICVLFYFGTSVTVVLLCLVEDAVAPPRLGEVAVGLF